jgi:UDP-N-acetylglucosamine transferase subunit ALG13
VVFAGNQWQQDYIQKTFPDIQSVFLEGYNVSYKVGNTGLMTSVLLQLPGIWKAIRREHHWLQEFTSTHNIDGVLSDNRYGLFHPSIPSVIMTHQVQVLTGLGSMADRIFRRFLYFLLGRFAECWIVDEAGHPNLSGKLAHPGILPLRARYLGLLSQLESRTEEGTKESDLLVLLSGPEPQRTNLSRILWEQVISLPQKIVFVEGSRSVEKPDFIPEHVTYHTWVQKSELQKLIEGTSLVVCRSGYSSLMDLVRLGKKGILIPTPGQTEQEYLARYLHSEGVFYSRPQQGFNLQNALQEAALFSFHQPVLEGAFDGYKKQVEEWLTKL